MTSLSEKASYLFKESPEIKNFNLNFTNSNVWSLEKFEAINFIEIIEFYLFFIFFKRYLIFKKNFQRNQIVEMFNQIKIFLTLIALSTNFKLDKKLGLFEIFEINFLIDQNLKPYFMDIEKITNIKFFSDFFVKIIKKVNK